MKQTLEKVLIKIGKKYIDGTYDWYHWRKINEENIPQNIVLPVGNQYTKNIALKESLHQKWMAENDPEKKGELIEYYIKPGEG